MAECPGASIAVITENNRGEQYVVAILNATTNPILLTPDGGNYPVARSNVTKLPKKAPSVNAMRKSVLSLILKKYMATTNIL
jgi:hypothetical protein